MHAGNDDERQAASKHGNAEEAGGVVEPDDSGGQVIAENAAKWSDETERNRNHDKQSKHRDNDALKNLRAMLVDEALNIRHDEHRQECRKNREE